MFTKPVVVFGEKEQTCSYSSISQQLADEWFKECECLEFLDRVPTSDTNYAQRSLQVFSDEAPGYYVGYFAKKMVPAKPLRPFLKTLLEAVNQEFEECFNLVVINKFKTFNDAIGKHIDGYGHGKHCIVTLSLGCTRTFQLYHKLTEELVYETPLKHGDVTIMANGLQRTFKHGVPANPHSIFSYRDANQTRYSLTLRWIQKDFVYNVNTLPDARECLVCKQPTLGKCQVCPECYMKKTFTCACGNKTGANWPCDDCYAKQTKQ